MVEVTQAFYSDIGSITKLLDSPGCFIPYERSRSGETINWNSSYTDVMIPVLQGLLASGVDKCNLVDFVWRAAVNMVCSVLMLTARVKDQNGFFPFAPSRTRVLMSTEAGAQIL